MCSTKTIKPSFINANASNDKQITNSGKRPSLIFFVSEDWYFYSHRLPLAKAAQNAGFDVAVITRINDHENIIRQAGIRIIPFELDRGGMNLFTDLSTITKLIHIYKHERPDIIHNVALKPVMYGSIAAKFSGVPHTINALTGLGWLFTSQSLKARVLSRIVIKILRYLLKSSHVILQNKSDVGLVNNWRIPRTYLVEGAGVDTEIYRPSSEPEGIPLVILPARMLWDKGVGDFVQAAKILKNKNVEARFILVGSPDPKNPSSVSQKQLSDWEVEGVVELWGHRTDMPVVFRNIHIVCLPSYREGLPKVLIEACASGRPIVTTDVPGCRDIVSTKFNGLLVPPHNSEALAQALGRLISDQELRQSMGKRGRKLATQKFSQDQIISETLSVYQEALG
ncbi:MAG TPA: glycosyltransferase family 1 protein [Chromatiales bacterium]|nr:glycosyltransferase family 1 protein [Chromatiales bacterium]